MKTGEFSRKAWVSLAVMLLGSSVIVAGIAATDSEPGACPSDFTEVQLDANSLDNKYVCAKFENASSYNNREFHNGSEIFEPVKDALGNDVTTERLGRYSVKDNVVTYTYESSSAPNLVHKARYCISNTSSTVYKIVMGDGTKLDAMVQANACPQ